MSNKTKIDSLGKRYSTKLFTNFLSVPINLIMHALIPRSLGPHLYGDFNFLTNFFTQFFSFFDMGTSTAFYTKLSQRPQEKRLVSFYLNYMALACVIVAGFVFVAQSTRIHRFLWPGQGLIVIYLALFLGIVTWGVQVMNGVMDAHALTTSAELGRILQKFIGLFVIVFLFVAHKLTLKVFFLYHYCMYGLLLFIFFRLLKKNQVTSFRYHRLNNEEALTYAKEFYHFSHPLFVLSLIGVGTNILDRWLLQKWGGSIQQGFFSLAFQIGMICILFTSAMTPLIIREFSIAYKNNDHDSLRLIFRRYVPLFCSIAAFIASFICINASLIVVLLGGGEFRNAALTVSIMAFFPLYQTYGQLSGSLLFTTGRNKLYRNIGTVFNLLSIPFVLFILAPGNYHGLNMGSVGLAAKIVVFSAFAVNVQLYFNARFLGISFKKLFMHQFYSLGVLLIIAKISSLISCFIFKGELVQLIISGSLYVILSFITVVMIPDVFFVSREQLMRLKVEIAGFFRKR